MNRASGSRSGPWRFAARFRRGAYSWQGSSLACQRLEEARREIATVARQDPVAAADGAVTLIERIVPAIEHIDSSSGRIGTCVANTLDALVAIIAAAPATQAQRAAWLDRLFEALNDDGYGYLDGLGEDWGRLCVTPDLANEWADRLLPVTRMVFADRRRGQHGIFKGTSACLASLLTAGRTDEVLALLELDTIRFWPYRRFGAEALLAEGRRAEALRYAEDSRSQHGYDDLGIDRLCERILLDSGLVDEAYRRYGLRAHTRGTYLATYRAVQAQYPQLPAEQVLRDLADSTPGQEGKWFAAAKSAGLLDLALELAARSPTDPKTLVRAARDHQEPDPLFAHRAAMLALTWLCAGHGYDIASLHVRDAYRLAVAAGEAAGMPEAETCARVRELVAAHPGNDFVARALRFELA